MPRADGMFIRPVVNARAAHAAAHRSSCAPAQMRIYFARLRRVDTRCARASFICSLSLSLYHVPTARMLQYAPQESELLSCSPLAAFCVCSLGQSLQQWVSAARASGLWGEPCLRWWLLKPHAERHFACAGACLSDNVCVNVHLRGELRRLMAF